MSSSPSWQPENRVLDLAGNEIHVWVAFDGDARDAAQIAGFESMLEPGEHDRRARLYSEPQRHQFLVTRALQRAMLASYAPGVAARDLRFVVGEHGKPALAPEFATLNLHFNLAHTDGLVALAVSREAMLGIDVENVNTRTAPLPIAGRFFSAAEARDLAALPAAEQNARFYALWTLKESWLKATGLGLAAGLGNVSFGFDRDHRAMRVEMANDDARRWRFWQASPGPLHRLALAVRASAPPESGGSARVRMWRCVPGAPQDREALPAPITLLGQEERAQP